MSTTKPSDNFKKFIAEMRAHPEFKNEADALEHAFAQDDLTADTNPDLAAVYFGIEWILKQPRDIEEKLKQICRLFAQEGKKVHVASMRDFTGWK